MENLEKYRENKEWDDFFNPIDELNTLTHEINEEMHKDPCDLTELNKKAKSFLKQLDMKKNDFANKTANNVEFDAVHKVISELEEEFRHAL